MPHPTDDLADNWCALARKVLNQALRDARLPSRRYEVADFAESDFCALLCEVVGIGWRPYMRAALRAVEGVIPLITDERPCGIQPPGR